MADETLSYENLPLRQEIWFQIKDPASDKAIASAAAYRQPSRSNERAWMVSNVHVDPKHRRQGLAKRILDSVIELLGHEYLFLTVDPYGEIGLDADQLAAFYARFGFVRLDGPTYLMSRQPTPRATNDCPVIFRTIDNFGKTLATFKAVEIVEELPSHEDQRVNSRGIEYHAKDELFHPICSCPSCGGLLSAKRTSNKWAFYLECGSCGRSPEPEKRSRSVFEAWDRYLAMSHEHQTRVMFGPCNHSGIAPYAVLLQEGCYVAVCSSCGGQLTPVAGAEDILWAFMEWMEAERERIKNAHFISAARIEKGPLSGDCQKCNQERCLFVAVTDNRYYHLRCKTCNSRSGSYVTRETAIRMDWIMAEPPAPVPEP